MTTLEGDRIAERDSARSTVAREELAKADSRAGLILATLGAALTALLGAISTGVITPGQYAAIPQLLVWSGCAACAPSLVLLGLAAKPRPGSTAATPLESLSRTTSLKYRRIHQAMTWGAVFLVLTLAGTLAGALT
ncbi:hypothetical protein [Streptomyces purpurascens]|uniref:Pycsar effector protein domain-containing protein n=1 Tax=Streptomyces purpurascens TaxID=1924 RepID=A0ABZ1MNQ4_STREF|nr:hypothetical protein [Streptomyces purpurascens]MCE7048042.1 hypothetical protein [Streptomyces purpurascens]GHA29978.1 hypothetical protein GCM10010303_45840 [Streptomyces purpurascens]